LSGAIEKEVVAIDRRTKKACSKGKENYPTKNVKKRTVL
jgi:hypothetical protein